MTCRLRLGIAAFAFLSFTGLPPALTGSSGLPMGVTEARAAATDPEGIVREIYGQWAAPCCNYFNVIDTHFSPQLMKLYRDVEEGAGDDIEYAIDFDIFLDAQDEDTVTDVATKLTEAGANKAVVDVTYRAFGDEHAGSYTFVKTAKGWKIDDMGWRGDRDQLRAMLNGLKEDQRKSR